MRLKNDFFVFGEAITKSNNTCQHVKGVVLSYVDGDATERNSSLQETHFSEADKKQNVKTRVYTPRNIGVVVSDGFFLSEVNNKSSVIS